MAVLISRKSIVDLLQHFLLRLSLDIHAFHGSCCPFFAFSILCNRSVCKQIKSPSCQCSYDRISFFILRIRHFPVYQKLRQHRDRVGFCVVRNICYLNIYGNRRFLFFADPYLQLVRKHKVQADTIVLFGISQVGFQVVYPIFRLNFGGYRSVSIGKYR